MTVGSGQELRMRETLQVCESAKSILEIWDFGGGKREWLKKRGAIFWGTKLKLASMFKLGPTSTSPAAC